MDFSPQSVFWDCLYARCYEEMDSYLRAGSFWERIPNGYLKNTCSFALHYEYWRWYYQIYFHDRIARRRIVEYSNREIYLYDDFDNRVIRLAGWNVWQCLTYKEKVKATKCILKEFQKGSFVSQDDYMKSGACNVKDATRCDIESVLISKQPFPIQIIAEKLAAGIESLGWDWQYKYDENHMLVGPVFAFGRHFILSIIFEEKFFLSYSLCLDDNGLVFQEGYSHLMGLGPDRLISFGCVDLDADVEAFMMMLNRLAWLVASSLDDAENGVKPISVRNSPPPCCLDKPQREAVCVCNDDLAEVMKEEKELLTLLKSEGFVGLDAEDTLNVQGIIESIEQFGSEKLFLVDTECVNDGIEYAAILERLNTVAGETVIFDATSFLDPQKSVAGVEFTVAGKVYKGKWRQEDDWMSAKFAELLSKAMEHFPGRFVSLPGGDQCARILYFKSRDTGDKVEKLLERIKAEEKK